MCDGVSKYENLTHRFVFTRASRYDTPSFYYQSSLPIKENFY